MDEKPNVPKLKWDHGTAYDFFASLYAVHNPDDFGLRPSWAAGIRSRLPAESRELFQTVMRYMGIPAFWLPHLPEPKAASTVLDALEKMNPEDILPALALNPDNPEECEQVFRGVMKRGRCDQGDVEKYKAFMDPAHAKMIDRNKGSLEKWLGFWAKPGEFGQAYRTGLREYYEGFFREEERRIAPDVQRGLARAQDLASRLTVSELFEELSQGIRVEHHLTQSSIVLVPCYWCTPRILYAQLSKDEQIILFGARPPEASLIPGDAVPARLLLALEALSDPTRLTILRTLSEKPLTQAEIARSLRLRPPTISHHLKHLRIAGLIAYIGTGKDETRYGARIQQVEQSCADLKAFLGAR